MWSKTFICVLITLFIVTFFVGYNTYSKRDYVNEKLYPIEASKFIKENLDYKNIRLFNQYDYGSDLLFDDIPVFIDSRADLYLKEFNKNCLVLEDYFDAKDDYNYSYIFNKYDITHVIVKNSTMLSRVMKNQYNYEIIYSDDYFTIYDLGD